MKKSIQLMLIGISFAVFIARAENEAAWTSANEILAHYCESAIKDGGGFKFKARPSGERYFYSVDGREKVLINYNQEIVIPIGSTLELSGKHANIRIEVLNEKSSMVVLAQRRVDNSSFGKGVVISRAAMTIDGRNKQAELDRKKADAIFLGRKFFALEASGRGSPKTDNK